MGPPLSLAQGEGAASVRVYLHPEGDLHGEATQGEDTNRIAPYPITHILYTSTRRTEE
jgi:hypothetical protein